MSEAERIEETTVGWVPGVSVGVGNILLRDYHDASGRLQRGPTARLALRPDDPALPESELLAHEGQELDLAGRRYRVETISLQSEGSDNGYVVLSPLPERP